MRRARLSKPNGSVKQGTTAIHLAGAGACCVILAGASALGVVPAVKAHNADQVVRDQLSSVSLELDELGAAHMRLIERVERERAAVESRDVALSTPDGVNRLMADLTGMFESMGLAILVLQPRPVEAAEPLSESPVQVAIQGTLAQVLDLFARLDAQHPDIHVRSVSMNHVGPGTIQVRAEFRWLVLNE